MPFCPRSTPSISIQFPRMLGSTWTGGFTRVGIPHDSAAYGVGCRVCDLQFLQGSRVHPTRVQVVGSHVDRAIVNHRVEHLPSGSPFIEAPLNPTRGQHPGRIGVLESSVPDSPLYLFQPHSIPKPCLQK